MLALAYAYCVGILLSGLGRGNRPLNLHDKNIKKQRENSVIIRQPGRHK